MSIMAVSFYDQILYPFNYVVSWILYSIHELLVLLGMKEGPNFAWVLSIIGLTLVVRSAIIPLYAKQIKSQRAMQEIQPLIQEINEKYKGRKDQVSVQQKNQEVFALYRENGVKPLASCLPLLIQMPFIISLYRVLFITGSIVRQEPGYSHLGPITRDIASQIEQTLFLGIPLSTTFRDASAQGNTLWMVIIVTMAVVMAVIMFSTMWLLSVKNLPKNSSDQNAKMMKFMAFLGPAMTLMFSFVVQMGVLVYWLVTNLFTAAQQTVILHKAPTVGSPAHDKFLEKANRKYDAIKKNAEDEYQQLLDKHDLSEKDISEAWTRIQRAEDKIDTSSDEPVIDLKKARFKSSAALRKELLNHKLDSLSAEKTRERLGDDDPFKDDERADAIHEVVAHRRQMAEKLKEERISLGLEREKRQSQPKKKGFFAKRMEEAMEMQAQQQRSGQRQGQRYQPTKASRAQRSEQAKKARKNQAKKNPKNNLSQEEIERRRQERRKAARAQAKKKRKK